MTYLENTGKDYAGDATNHGHYRLVPAGTKFIAREYPGDTEAPVFADVESKDGLTGPLLLEPVAGWSEVSFKATTRNGRPVYATAKWTTPSGQTVFVSTVEVLDWALPIDIYLHFDDALTLQTPTTIAGAPAVVEAANQARRGGVPPPPPGATVRAYFGGGELILRSQEADAPVLLDLAETLLPGLLEPGGAR